MMCHTLVGKYWLFLIWWQQILATFNMVCHTLLGKYWLLLTWCVILVGKYWLHLIWSVTLWWANTGYFWHDVSHPGWQILVTFDMIVANTGYFWHDVTLSRKILVSFDMTQLENTGYFWHDMTFSWQILDTFDIMYHTLVGKYWLLLIWCDTRLENTIIFDMMWHSAGKYLLFFYHDVTLSWQIWVMFDHDVI